MRDASTIRRQAVTTFTTTKKTPVVCDANLRPDTRSLPGTAKPTAHTRTPTGCVVNHFTPNIAIYPSINAP
jgi:hypothetical protein